MPVFKRWLFIGILLASSCPLKAQDADSLLAVRTDTLLTFADSLSIFNLIDSLLLLDELDDHSQLAVRLAYNSNVLSAGRTLGIEQFGLMPSVSFYHKSGFFADVTGFWSKDFEPKYYLTVLSGGYMHTFSKYFSVTGNYDRYFYNSDILDQAIDFKNTLGITSYFDYKLLTARLDYSFYFGNQTAHRFMPSVGLNLSKRNFLKLERVRFLPSAYMLFGNSISTQIETNTLTGEIFISETNVFGIMNYALSFPVYISHKNWSLYLGYTYNIPEKLKNEIYVPPKAGYISAGLTYYIDLRPNKLSL
ncbi:MAG: hypothetical protein JNK18_14950 [Cyclobacteriaceae bacterium]|nr:hypothetical protein [Cyclobacteriaceae bacterium]